MEHKTESGICDMGIPNASNPQHLLTSAHKDHNQSLSWTYNQDPFAKRIFPVFTGLLHERLFSIILLAGNRE